MTAGHIVILSLIGLIFTFANTYGAGVGYGTSIVWIGFTLFILCLELLVAFLQAYIFTMLSALFIGMAVEEHDHEHEHGEAHA
jgi:F-type H+-transporting ATPase subunit a